jgi:hypothetical protein
MRDRPPGAQGEGMETLGLQISWRVVDRTRVQFPRNFVRLPRRDGGAMIRAEGCPVQ